MSGSGPTVFGVYATAAAAEQSAAQVARDTGWWTAAVSPI
jgi:4-diphosphocytidyl-2C-methyl-D-erythritol kinase